MAGVGRTWEKGWGKREGARSQATRGVWGFTESLREWPERGGGGAWLEGRLNSAERVARAQCPVILGDLGLSPRVLWG